MSTKFTPDRPSNCVSQVSNVAPCARAVARMMASGDSAGLGSIKGDVRIERHHPTDLGERDYLIRLVLAHLAGIPFGQFQLHHGRHDPSGLFGQLPGQYLCGGRADQPFYPDRSVDEDHQNRFVRSWKSRPDAPRARPFNVCTFRMASAPPKMNGAAHATRARVHKASHTAGQGVQDFGVVCGATAGNGRHGLVFPIFRGAG